MILSFFIAFSVLATTFGGAVEFLGNIFPDQVGWSREYSGTPQRQSEGGIFLQTFDGSGDAEVYRTSISAFGAAPSFFAEWRMQTDAPAALLDTLQLPAGFVLSGNTNVFYHFRFTDSVALFTRSDLALIYYPIEPDVLHTYRIELLANDTYRYLIDGNLVDTGPQPGPFPTAASQIVWGGSYYAPSQTIQWDYIRYGVIPEPATGLLLLGGSAFLAVRRAKAHSPSKDKGGVAQVFKLGAINFESRNLTDRNSQQISARRPCYQR